MSPQDARTQARATPANEKAHVEPRRTDRVPENDNAPLVGFSQIAALAAAGDSARPEAIRPDTLLNLQKRAGNAAVVSLMRPMAARRASLLVQRRAKPVKKSAGGGYRPSTVAQRAPAAGATATAPTTEAPSEKEDVDTSEFTDDPKAAAAKLASMPAPARPVPPPPVLPAPAPKPPVVKKAPAKKVAGPVKKGRPPAKKKAGRKPQKAPAVGEIVKKPAPPLPPRYVPGSKLPPPPVPPKVIPPTQDPAFKKVAMAAKQTVKAAKKHPKGKQESGAALAAAKSPANEQLALAQVVRTGHMEQKAKPKPFNEAAFVEAVMAEIEKTKPKNFDESGKVDQKAESAKGAIAQQVGANKKAAAGDVEKESKEEPKLSEGEDRKEQPLPPLEIAKPGGLAASAAMPAPVPNEQIDFRHGPASVDKEMADAGITEQQLAESNEPEFIGALEAKKEGEEHAQKAPAEIRKAEGDILKNASAQVAGAEKNAVMGANSAIGGSTKAIGAAKKSTIDKDEAERKKVSDGINDIFKATQKDVGDILKNLDTTVDDLFTKSEKSIREAFTYDWKVRLQNYKDERYSGFWGPGRWVRDKFRGLPKKAKELFAKSQAMYESMMRKLVKRIAGIVSAELTKATNRIKEGRQQVITYVQGLKGEQAKFGAEAAKEMDERFDQLDADVKDKFDEMATTVAKKYSESRTAVAEEVKEAWDAEKGLIDKAIDKIKGVYKAISDLKDLFFRVLAKIADVITTILANPVRFIKNFFNAVKAGVERFRDNIETHLKSGLMGWLTGNLGGKGIEIPDSFDLPSMGKLVLSVFGLGWTFIKERLAKKIGPAGMAALDSGAALVEKLKGGPAALWEMVSEKFTDFGSMVMDKIQDFIQNKIVMAGITFLISMLNPASAFIKACKMIYDVIVFIIDRGKEIGEFVESIIDAAGDIARGGGGGVPEKIEGVLAKALPLAIGFCASLLSLGGIGDKVRDIIDGVRKPIFKAMDKVIDFVVNTTRPIWEPAKRLFERGAKKGRELYAAGKKKLDEGVESVKAGARRARGYVTHKASAAKAKVTSFFKPQKKGLTMAGTPHTLTAAARGDGRVLISMASDEGLLSTKIREAMVSLKKNAEAATDPEQRGLIESQMSQLAKIATIAADLEQKAASAGKAKVLESGAPPGFADAMAALAAKIEAYGNKNKVADITKATTESVVVDLRLLAKFGLPMASYLQAQKVADDLGAAIDIRPTNMTAEKLYEEGANPKSEEFKEKTLTEDDTLLGAPREHIGKVAWFNPSRPNKAATTQLMKEEGGPAWVERWWKRYHQRKEEYAQYSSKIKKKLKEGEILLVSKMGGGGSKGGLILDGLRGLPYTGDHDIFEVHGDAAAVIAALKAPPFRVQHGAHVDWPRLPSVVEKGGMDESEKQIFNSIIQAHAPGGKALLRINPKGPPTAVSSKTPPLAKATKKGVGSAPDIDGTVVQADPPLTGFAALAAKEKELAEQRQPDGGGSAPSINETFDVDGEKHSLTSRDDGELVVASDDPIAVSTHPDKAVRKAYDLYRQAVEDAPTAAQRKAVSARYITPVLAALKSWLKTVAKQVPRESAPGIGNVAPYGSQVSSLRESGVPRWYMEAEHLIPRGASSAAFALMGHEPVTDSEYDAQHTIMIYKDAADLKTNQKKEGDKALIARMKKVGKELISDISGELAKTKASHRQRVLETTIKNLLHEVARNAVGRTYKAVAEDSKTHGKDRGKRGSPEKATPTEAAIFFAANKQAEDIMKQLRRRRKSS